MTPIVTTAATICWGPETGWVNFDDTGQVTTTVSFAGLVVPVPQSSHCSANAATNNTDKNEHSCVRLKLYLRKSSQVWQEPVFADN